MTMDPEDAQGKPTQASQPLLGIEEQEEGDPFEDPEGDGGSNGSGRGSKGNSQTESRSASRHPPPTKREYAIRRYHGIGRDGQPIEPMTAQALADKLNVSRRTINRWVNEDTIPLVRGWSTSARLTLLACVVTRDREALEEYLLVRELESEGQRGSRVTSPGREGQASPEMSGGAPPESPPNQSAGSDMDPHPDELFPDDVW